MGKTRIKIKNDIDLLPFEEDFYVHHELKEDSEFMTDRVSIIHGEVPIDNENKDGTIDVMSSKDNWYNHWVYWLSYLKKYYLKDDFMRQWCKNGEKDYFLLIIQCLSTYKDIIALDNTDLDEEGSRQMLILFIPESITESQYKVLEENADYFSSYKDILIQGGESVEDSEIFFDASCDLPINTYIQGSKFSDFLKDTLKEYQNQEFRK